MTYLWLRIIGGEGWGDLVTQVLFPAVFTVCCGGEGKINKFE